MSNNNHNPVTHRVREFIQKVPKDTRDVLKEIVDETGIPYETVNNYYREKVKSLTLERAKKLANYFSKFFPTSALDILIDESESDSQSELNATGLAKK